MTNLQTVIIMDLQDNTHWWETTLEDAKRFYSEMFDSEEFESYEEEKEFDTMVENADFEKLGKQLEICDYTLFKNENEMNRWKEEVGA
ncbi:hypothetical protein ORN01_25345 [Bacillus cereus]|uniref:hypothetical protein n=1 Tax=Bacillus cereus TaxID=1396 RepID=UPI002AC135AA|nr:hypothetical protein [Bacillus cereus]MDZ4632285.1 hypothetical protein [Bacillus cereus]